MEEERRTKERMQSELARVMESRKALELQWNEERIKFEEEKKQYQDNGSADESRLRRMQEELDICKVMLDAKEREVFDMQSRSSIGLEMYEAIQLLQQGTVNEDGQNFIRIVDGGTVIVALIRIVYFCLNTSCGRCGRKLKLDCIY